MVRVAARRVHGIDPQGRTWEMLFLEAAKGQDIRDLIRSAVANSRTLHDAAAKLGIEYATLWRWRKRLGMQ